MIIIKIEVKNNSQINLTYMALQLVIFEVLILVLLKYYAILSLKYIIIKLIHSTVYDDYFY